MEIVVHNRNSLLQRKFQKNLLHFNRSSQLRSVMHKMIEMDFRCRSRTKKTTPNSSVVRNPTPPKNLRLLANPIPIPTTQPCSKPQKSKLKMIFPPLLFLDTKCLHLKIAHFGKNRRIKTPPEPLNLALSRFTAICLQLVVGGH